jgi:hypothetical protein
MATLSNNVLMTPGHFLGFRPGDRLHAHTGTCIKCGSDNGDTLICASVVEAHGRLALRRDRIAGALCPTCGHKVRNLGKLADKLWRNIQKRGCPCCWDSGLHWYPSHG